MLTFIVRRLLALPLVLLAITLLLVGLMQFLTPAQRAGSFIRSENQLRNLDLIIRQNGLDQPFYVQYGHWIANAVQGNLGYSRASGRPVVDTIKERFPRTLELALYAAAPIILVGIWLGTAAGLHKDKFIDQFARVLAVLGYSLPTFVLGIWLLVIFYGALGWLPGFGNLSNEAQITLLTSGMKTYTGLITIDALLNGQFGIFWDAFQHLILPTLTLATVSSATILKVMRSSLIETLSQDYVRTARSKGLHEKDVNIKHARRNALLPVTTLAGFTVVGLLNGVIITETIFAYPGIGSWGAQAATILDFPGVMGFAMFTAMVVVLSNLAVDILYGVVDPRVRFD